MDRRAIDKKRCQLEPDIIDSDGGKYSSLESRVRQVRGYDKLLFDISQEFGCSDKVDSLKKQNMDTALSLFWHALNLESNKNLINSFDESAQNFYLKKLFETLGFYSFLLKIDYLDGEKHIIRAAVDAHRQLCSPR